MPENTPWELPDDPNRVLGGKRAVNKSRPLPFQLQVSAHIISKLDKIRRRFRGRVRVVDLVRSTDNVGHELLPRSDYARYLDAKGTNLPWLMPCERVLYRPSSNTHYVIRRRGKEFMCFTDVGEALSQARSMEYYAGWKKVTVVSVT